MLLSRKQFVAYGLAAAVAAIVFFVAVSSGSESAQAGAPVSAMPVQVDVATVDSRTISDRHEYSGRLEAVQRVAIRPLVSGTLIHVHFADGALIAKGAPLFTIDPRPYEAAVNQARAQLVSAQARAAYTQSELARSQRLLKRDAIARRDFEEKRNAAREAVAAVDAAKAALQSAELDLEHTHIVAPIAGRVSRAERTPGNIVGPSDEQALTNLVSVSPIYASFDVDEQTFLQSINGRSSADGKAARVSLGLAGDGGYPRQGRVASIDNGLDPQTGTIRVRAVFDNPEGELRPGLFARLRLESGRLRNAVLIDEKAIGTDQSKRFVLVVDDQNRVSYRTVTLGASRDGKRVINAGLGQGERIVVSGLQRARPGDLVSPTPSSLAANDSKPAAATTATRIGASAQAKAGQDNS